MGYQELSQESIQASGVRLCKLHKAADRPDADDYEMARIIGQKNFRIAELEREVRMLRELLAEVPTR